MSRKTSVNLVKSRDEVESVLLMINLKRPVFLCLFALLLSMSAAAQTSRRGAQPAARPTPAATAAATTNSAIPPNALAVVNNLPITLEDLNPEVREAVLGLDKNIGEVRRRGLTSQINRMLFEAEAKKRKITLEQLLDVEIYSRIPPPSAEEINYIYEGNRDQLGSMTLEEARPRIIAVVREQRAQSLMDDLATRLRMMFVVEWGTEDVNAQGLAPSTVLAKVADRALTLGDLNTLLQPTMRDMRQNVYEAERQAIEEKIGDVLMETEARRRRITRDDLIRIEISDKVRKPTDADIQKFYDANRGRIQGDLSARRAEIALYLEQEERSRLQQELVGRLRSGASVRMLLPMPEGYVQRISTDDDPSRGATTAPVTVVMFTDFQCPACAGTHPVLEAVLKQYGARVRLVVRDFPLDQHQWARKAAEAAQAANAQGKFFEYIDVLYRNQQALDVPSLKKYASDLGLDRARFDAELDNGKYAAEVAHDVQDGKAYGVSGTPTVFVNGVRLLNLGDRAIKLAIERAFEGAGQRAAATASTPGR